MSVKEFWEDNPDLFWAYRFSYYTDIKTKQEIFNHNAWLQGAYFYEAVSVALCNAFGKQKVQYAQKPYDLDRKENSRSDNDVLVAKIKSRMSQIQNLFSNKNKVALTKGENREVGEINE